MMKLVHHSLFRSLLRHPGAAALSAAGRSVTCRELVRQASLLAATLVVEGIRKGDRVAVLARDPIDCVTGMIGAARAAGAAVPVQSVPGYGEGVFAIVTTHADAAEFPDLLDRTAIPVFFLDEPLPVSPAAILPDPASRPASDDPIARLMELDEEDTAFVLDGLPVSHGGIGAAVQTQDEQAGLRELIGCPVTSYAGLVRVLARLGAGGTAVLTRESDSFAERLKLAQTNRCQAISLGQDDARILVNTTDRIAGRMAQSLRDLTLRIADLSIAEKKHLIRRFPETRIRVCWGFHAAPFASCLNLRRDASRLHTNGLPAPGLTIRNEQGGVCLPNVCGTITSGNHEGNGTMNPAGFIDESGYLVVLGNRTDNGYGAAASSAEASMEKILRDAYPDIDACIIGTPEPSDPSGEIPVLCYTAPNGSRLELSDVIAVLSGTVSRFVMPRMAVKLDRFPDGGRPLRRAELQRHVMQHIHPTTVVVQ